MTMTAAIIVNRSQIGAQVLTQLSFCVASSQVAENGRRRWTVVAKKEFRGKRGCGQKEMGGRRGGHLPKKREKESTQVEKYTAGQVPVRFPDHSFMGKIERTT